MHGFASQETNPNHKLLINKKKYIKNKAKLIQVVIVVLFKKNPAKQTKTSHIHVHINILIASCEGFFNSECMGDLMLGTCIVASEYRCSYYTMQ